MNQENDVRRKAIKEQKKERQKTEQEVLTGIINNESKTYTFTKKVRVLGGKVKEGTFTAKYLGVAARLRIGTIRAKLLEGAPNESIDRITDDIAYMAAYLSVALIQTPSWWSLEELDDYDDLKAMYLEVYNFMNSFRAKNGTDTNAGDSSDTTGTEVVEGE